MGAILITLIVGLSMFLVERIHPGRDWPERRSWWARAICLNLFQVAAILASGVLWKPWFESHRVAGVSHMSVAAGAGIGYLVITFVYYWWHRVRHEDRRLWRWLHRMHHARVGRIGACNYAALLPVWDWLFGTA